jgi:hypothetical protein
MWRNRALPFLSIFQSPLDRFAFGRDRLLTPQHFDAWLHGMMKAEDLKPAAEEALRAWPVAKRLNKIDGYRERDSMRFRGT